MDGRRAARGGAAGGGIAESSAYAGVVGEAVSAVRLQMDWRPLVGLTSADEGSVVERVLARVVLDRAIDETNRAIKKANR